MNTDAYPGYTAPAEIPRTWLNSLGWIALALTALDFALLVVTVLLPAWAPALIPVSIAAVSLAIVALVARGRRKAATLVAPIIAIALTVIISALASLVWLGQTVNHNQLEATPVSFPHSAEMANLYASTRSIERGIRSQATAYHWPSSVAADNSGRVIVGGKVLATLMSGETLSYRVTKGGEDFVLVIDGRVPGEYFYYDLDNHEIDWFCNAGDDACDGS